MFRRIATLRQRAVHLRSALRQIVTERPVEIAPTLLADAPQIFKLAYIAIGDADSAARLTADVLLAAPANEGAAVRLLIERLPQGWLSWPAGPGPSEWLRLRLRREQADRLLSVLGEWSAEERIGLALYLLWDVRRDDLDAWTGINGMAERVAQVIDATGQSMRLVTSGREHPACKEIAAELLEANDPQAGREIRLHTAGCEDCRRRASGLRQTTALLRNALNVFFRTPLPRNFEQILRDRQQPRLLPALNYSRHALLAAIVLIVLLGITQRTAPSETETAQAAVPVGARELIDQALNRFSRPAIGSGVLHERVRVGTGEQARLVERWYDYRSPQRLRVTVRQPDRPAPVLDLATDGISWIAYEVNSGTRRPVSTLVRNPEVATLMPLLRQLPFVGSFSEMPVAQEYMDLALLAQARRGNAVLLGTTSWRERPAYVLSSTQADVGRTILTIDRETLGLLEARVAPDAGGTSQTQRVWEAEVLEVLPRRAIPPGIFELSTRNNVVTEIDPRQFGLYPATKLDLDTAVRYSSLPIPEFVPGPPLTAHLRSFSGIRSALLQMYESEWSSLAIVVPRIPLRAAPLEELDHSFAHGRYSIQSLDLPQATMAWFVMDDAPQRVMQMYLWHALDDEAARERTLRQILDSLVLVDASNVQQYRQRFPAAVSEGEAGGQNLAQPAKINRAPLPPSQAARRRYLRSKLEQAYDSEPGRPRIGLLVR
jgi:hypothetical protein